MIAGGGDSAGGDDSAGGGDSAGGDSGGGSGTALSRCPTCGELPRFTFETQALPPSTTQMPTELTAAFKTLFSTPGGRIGTVPGQNSMIVPETKLPADVCCFCVPELNYFIVYISDVPYRRILEVLSSIVMCTRSHPLTMMAVSTECRGKCTLACNVVKNQPAADFAAMCALVVAILMVPQHENEEEEEDDEVEDEHQGACAATAQNNAAHRFNTACAMRLVDQTLKSPRYSCWIRDGEDKDGDWDPNWEPDLDAGDDEDEDDDDDDDDDEDM